MSGCIGFLVLKTSVAIACDEMLLMQLQPSSEGNYQLLIEDKTKLKFGWHSSEQQVEYMD